MSLDSAIFALIAIQLKRDLVMLITFLLLFVLVVILTLLLKIIAEIRRGQKQSSLRDLLSHLESLQSLTDRPAASETEFSDKLKDILKTLNTNNFELPDFVDLHLDRFRTAIEVIDKTVQLKRTKAPEVLDFANTYLAQVQQLSFAISIVKRELVQCQNLAIATLKDQDSRRDWTFIKWFQRSDAAGILTCAIVLFCFYAAAELDSQYAISFGGSAIVILGLIYEAQYLPRISSTGELRAKTIGAGVPKGTKANFREFFVTHFGFFQVIVGTILSTTGPYLIGWSNELSNLIKY